MTVQDMSRFILMAKCCIALQSTVRQFALINSHTLTRLKPIWLTCTGSTLIRLNMLHLEHFYLQKPRDRSEETP